MIEGVIVAIDERRHSGVVELDGVGWRVPADIPQGFGVGDRVRFRIVSPALNPMQNGVPRAVDVRHV